MIRAIAIALLVTTATTLPTGSPSSQCASLQQNRNPKDLYADSTDCHKYIQCFYLNSTYAIGYSRTCPVGEFWHDAVLTCMQEGSIPCVDRCLDDATSAQGCYAGTGCRQYFACSNTGSNGMCCPSGTQFNAATCGCDESATCTDACVQAGPAVATTEAPASQYNATVCQDSFGTYISSVAGQSNAYVLIDAEGQATTTLYCPSGVSFDLGTCRCNTESGATAPTTVQLRQATVWLSFNGDSSDHSVNKFSTFLFSGAQYDATQAPFGNGGSLAVNGGYLSVPGLKQEDFRNAASFCAFFKCNGACQVGGIISNNQDITNTVYTVILGTQSASTLNGKLNFWHPVGTQNVQSSFTSPSNSWNSVCVTYDGTAARLYVNGGVTDTEFVGSYLSISSFPLVVGNDPVLGSFNGNIADVLVTEFALTAAEVSNYASGNFAALSAEGFF
jgi:hypothetical protein